MDSGNGNGSIHGEFAGVSWEEEDVPPAYSIHAASTDRRSEGTTTQSVMLRFI